VLGGRFLGSSSPCDTARRLRVHKNTADQFIRTLDRHCYGAQWLAKRYLGALAIVRGGQSGRRGLHQSRDDRLPEAGRAATHAAAREHERSVRCAAGLLVSWGVDVASEANWRWTSLHLVAARNPVWSAWPTRIEAVQDSLAVVIALGLFAAISNAAGLIALKPALAGTDPLAATALRTGGGALAISVVALWPAEAFETPTKRTPGVVLRAIVPGFVGYIAAVSLQLYALRSYDAGIVAVLSSMAPVVMLPMTWIMSGDPPPLSAWLGAILAVLGAGIIFAG
jgi:uncharacterized membrane protein